MFTGMILKMQLPNGALDGQFNFKLAGLLQELEEILSINNLTADDLNSEYLQHNLTLCTIYSFRIHRKFMQLELDIGAKTDLQESEAMHGRS